MPAFLLSFLAKDGFKLLAILALFGGLAYGEHRFHQWEKSLVQQGYDQARKEDDAAQAIANAKAAQELAEANSFIAKTQAQIQALNDQLAVKAKELDDAKLSRQKLVADYSAGIKRMSIATIGATHCESGKAEQGNSSAAAIGDSQGRSDILPEVSAAILDFAGRYQDNVQGLSICMDAYNGLRDKLNQEQE